MTKSLLILAALTICCFIATVHSSTQTCLCRSYNSPVPRKFIKKLEVIPPSGVCRRTEIIITRRNGSKTCAKPGQWLDDLLSRVQDSTSQLPTASTIDDLKR